MRIAIVGAGNNSDYHINFSKAYAGAQIVAIVDADRSRAEAAARTHAIDRAFGSVAEMLREAKPDVVHVVTPPMTHFAIVREALEARCHVLVEKPLALNAAEAATLYEIAERHSVMLSPVHNHLFDPCMRRADALVKRGDLGAVTNVESYYGLNTNIPAFRDYPRPNVLPWLYSLPGGVYQDFLPHAIYPVLEYIGAPRSVTVKHRSTGVLPQGLPDEIRILVDGARAFGVITVSFAAKPHLHFIRIYGTNGMVESDINTMTTTVHSVSGLPKAAQKATYNLDDSWQKARSTVSNVLEFVSGKLKPYHGMMTLIHAFYDAVKTRGTPPVSRENALAVVRMMDDVFAQLHYEPLKHPRLIPAGRSPQPRAQRVLVTGGTGFVGRHLVRRLLADGYNVRVLARKLSNAAPLANAGAEVYWGDVADLESFGEAFEGCQLVVHLAAGTSGTEKDSQAGTIQGTRNLIELCRRHKPGRVVYISSCSVYGIAECPAGALVSESAAIERYPEKRGSYSASKQEAEGAVADYMRSGDVPVVILRPGTIYGPTGDLFTAMMGFSGGSTYVVIGTGSFVLPFVHVDNLTDAVALSLDKPEAIGEIFNVVDPERITKKEYVDRVIRRVDPAARVFYLPYSVLYAITWFQEKVFGIMGRRPVLTRYRLTSSQKPIVYDSSKIAARLGWRMRVSLAEGLRSLVSPPSGPDDHTGGGKPAEETNEVELASQGR